MIARAIVLTYFSLFFLSAGLVNLSGRYILHGLFVAPGGLYAAWRITLWATHHATHRQSRPSAYFGRMSLATMLYATAYGVLYFFRAESGIAALGSFVALLTHVLFWHFVFFAPPYHRRPRLFFQDILLSLVLGSVVGVIGALSFVGWDLTPGMVHNLAEHAPFVRSDLDVPFLALALGVWGVVLLFLRRQAPDLQGYQGRSPSRTIGLLLLAWALAVLLLYSRRTPLIALLGTTAFLFLPGGLGRKLAYLAVLFPFIPFVWDTAAAILVPLTQNPIADAILARNSIDDYLTATNRAFVWAASIDYLLTPSLQHLVGYGGAPIHLLRADWTHTHNAFIQVVFDAGLLVLILAVILLVTAFRRIVWTIRARYETDHAYILLGVLVAWLVIASVEPGLRGVSIVHLAFILIVLCIGNLHGEARRLRRAIHYDTVSRRASQIDST